MGGSRVSMEPVCILPPCPPPSSISSYSNPTQHCCNDTCTYFHNSCGIYIYISLPRPHSDRGARPRVVCAYHCVFNDDIDTCTSRLRDFNAAADNGVADSAEMTDVLLLLMM